MPPFSGKQKKKQLQERRQRKKQQSDKSVDGSLEYENGSVVSHKKDDREIPPEEFQYGADRCGIRSVFRKETAEEVAARKKLSYDPLVRRVFMGKEGIPFGSWFTMPWHECAASASLTFSVDIPTRGWTPIPNQRRSTALDTSYGKFIQQGSSKEVKKEKDESERHEEEEEEEEHHEEEEEEEEEEKEESDCFANIGNRNPSAIGEDLESLEAARFAEYLSAIDHYSLPQALHGMQVSSFERNLDVWRQLWRTVEQSDVVVIVADVRYLLVHLPLSLLHYIVNDMGKPCVVVLNKADLVPAFILDQWMAFMPQYFRATGVTTEDGPVKNIPLLSFTSLPADETALGAAESENAGKRRKKQQRRSKLYEQLRTGKLQLVSLQEVKNDSEDSDDNDADGRGGMDTYGQTENFKGMEKAERELQHGKRDHKELRIVSDMITALLHQCRAAAGRDKDNETKDENSHTSPLHIGVVGHPNVGKSSILNCIRGTKVVSVSSTPGHTKHLQTIPLPDEGVVLIDSPGLAIPVFGLPRALQAVIGTHQIAQTRDPQSGVAFLASHLPLERIYGLRKDPSADETAEWSPYELCESYAHKKGYFVKHGKGTLDVHRGSIEILQEAYEGRLVLFFSPPSIDWLSSESFARDVRPYLHMQVELSEREHAVK